MKIKKVMLKVKKFVIDNEPAILTGAGVTTMVSGAISLVPATIKAKNDLDDYKAEHKREVITKKTIIKVCGKHYIVPASLLVGGTACTVMGQCVSLKRNAVLKTLAATSASALAEYKQVTASTLGDKAVQKVNDAVTQKHVNENPVEEDKIINTGDGETLFLEPATNQYFYSTWDKVKNIMANVNLEGTNGAFGLGFISLSEFLNKLELNVSPTTDTIGWDLTRNHSINIMTQTAALSADGKPCCSWIYTYEPVDVI